MTNQPRISAVIPFLNEEGSLNELYRQLASALDPLGTFECVFVDDGSTDESYSTVTQLAEQDAHIRIIKFRKNLGKSAALSEGFAAARGSIIVMLDADLQDEPSEIPKLVTALDKADLVSGWKEKRNDPWTKTFPSRVFNGVARMMFGLKLHDLNTGLKVMRAEVAHAIDLYGEFHRFIPVLAHLEGFRVTELPVVHHERKFGVSKYGWQRFVRGSFDLMTVAFLARFRNTPLHFFGSVGALIFLAGFIAAAYLTVLKAQGLSIGNRPLLTFAVLAIVTGLQFLFTGFLAELIVSRSRQRRNPVEQIIDHGRDEHSR